MRIQRLMMIFFTAITIRIARPFNLPLSANRPPALLRSLSCTRLFSSAKPTVCFLGTPEVAASCLEKLQRKGAADFDITCVVTQPARPAGRKKKLTPTPVQTLAETFPAMKILTPENAKNETFLEELEALEPDLCVTAAYGCYLPKRFLKIPKLGTVNIHPSLLPRWRGASPVQRSLEAGDTQLGVTVLYTVSAMDAGPIISQVSRPNDDVKGASQELEELFDLGTEELLKALPSIFSGQITFDTAAEQDEEQVTKAKMIGKDEAILDFSTMGAVEVHNRARGLEMWPGTYFYFYLEEDDASSKTLKKVKVGKSAVISNTERATDLIGSELTLLKGKGAGLGVLLADGSALELFTVQPEGKKMMDAKSFVNGLGGKKVLWAIPPPQPESI
ncbi:hypothetical protein TrST_g7148 [Triparma strigata]|uniref:Methionyl-tRNA formyltransferase, mitochondrial n=1 Tax=Triparma strigata TaxID=1606541 RepID=A0A9W7EM48_9STRA|nr:hypothetical protein TrST_g7148 [Triparma strigata]